MWKKIKESIVDMAHARATELRKRINDARVADLERRLLHVTTQYNDVHNVLDTYYLKDHKVREALGAKAFEATADAAHRVARELDEARAELAAIRAVAARVRAERPACLVARAVALGVDVRVAEDRCGWLVGMLESADLDEVVCREVPAADVPATLASLLYEVEAARKGGAK